MRALTKLIVTLFWLVCGFSAEAGNICDTGGVDLVKDGGNSNTAPSKIKAKGGIGGTGHGEDKGGIGGTGISDDGIGGTGILPHGGIGGTGWREVKADQQSLIIGVVTGFASVCVNGVEVHYDNQTPVDDNGVSGNAQALQIGQTVYIKANGTGQEVKAQRISILHPLGGPVTRVDLARNKIDIMGKPVDISGAINRNQTIKIGDQMRVSGLGRQNGPLYATRLEPMPNGMQPFTRDIQQPMKTLGVKTGDMLHVQGYAKNIGNDQININGITLSVPKNLQLQPSDLKSVAIARGKVSENGKVIAETIELNREEKILERGGKKSQNFEKIKQNKSSSSEKEQSKESTETNKISDENSLEKISKETKEIEEDTHEAQEKSEERSEKAQERSQKAVEKLNEKIEKTENEKVEKAEKSDKSEKVERTEKIEKTEKAEKVEKPEKIEKVEKVEKSEKVEKPEKIEKPEKTEKPEKVEKPEKIEKSGKD